MDQQQPRGPLGMPASGSAAAQPIVPNIAAASGAGLGVPAVERRTALPVTWVGNPWSLTGLSFLNFVLTLITFGIYGFWGRTEVRKRIWASVRLAGEPLEYTGTGKELFLGFLFVIGVVFVPLLLISLATQVLFAQQKAILGGTQVVLYAFFFYLVGVAMYRARRYRLTRTNWRGIRGALVNTGWAYGWTSFWTLVFLPVLVIGAVAGLSYSMVGPLKPGHVIQNAWTSGAIALLLLIAWLWLVPWRATKLYRHITNDMTFGDRPFSFIGSAGPLYARFVVRWIGVVILAIVTAYALYATGIFSKLVQMNAAQQRNQPVPSFTGREIATMIIIFLVASFLYSIITAWYRAAQANIFAAGTRFEGIPLKLSVTAGGLIWLFVTNYLIGTFSLGVLRPVAEARAAKYFVERFAFDGPIELAQIAQSRAALGKTGEGLAQAFDVDAF